MFPSTQKKSKEENKRTLPFDCSSGFLYSNKSKKERRSSARSERHELWPISGALAAELGCYKSGLTSLPLELGLLPKLEKLWCFGLELEDQEMQAQVASRDFMPSPGVVSHLRTRAQAELTGRLTKRASPASGADEHDDSGAAAGRQG